ncbi:hypothetical protein [Pseudoalteromonas sp. T1lg24]|uniref:hypothetical protein n=1 Tax=Pseudoalteromonas sp. T1lg24 TaxID=2077099 RepID=UPI000CF74320|nr:hypothetical protein [Pseudoalteromonas sp. T1lg24]
MRVIIPFVSRSELSAKENLQRFIVHAKSSKIFKGEKANIWEREDFDFEPWIKYRGSNRSYSVRFVNLESKGNAKKNIQFLSPSFIDAAKALVVYAFGIAATKPYRWNIVLRYIEKAFRDMGRTADLTQLECSVLDRAADLIIKEGVSTVSECGPDMNKIVELVNELGLTSKFFDWKFPTKFQRNNDRSVNVLPTGVPIPSSKIPHLKCIIDLSLAFTKPSSGGDIITTSWFALAMYSPSRISEILSLSENCITEMDGVFALSWKPSKRGGAVPKYSLSDEWDEVAEKAISRLIEYGKSARKAAKWYLDHPNELYLPIGTEHLRGEHITKHEIMKIIGSDYIHDATISKMGILPTSNTTRDPERIGNSLRGRLYYFDSLEKWVLGQLPDSWVADKVLGTLAHNALFCVPRHCLRSNVSDQIHIPSLVNEGQILKDLGKATGKCKSIFQRHNLFHPETRKYWEMTTHQPRHFLNTLAQSKYVTQTLIAFWSGRDSVDQNDWYNHIPQEAFIEAYVAMGKNAPKEINVLGSLSTKAEERRIKEAISYDQALQLELGSIISTRFGLCRHNYALTPCPKDKDCIGCGEHTFIKGDKRQIGEAESQLRIELKAIEHCEAANKMGEPGVDRWMKKHQQTAKRWSEALEQLTDPLIEDGTIFTLSPPTFSQSKAGLSVEIKNSQSLDESDEVEHFEALLSSRRNL